MGVAQRATSNPEWLTPFRFLRLGVEYYKCAGVPLGLIASRAVTLLEAFMGLAARRAIVTIPVASVSHRTVTKLLTLRARCLTLVTEGSGCPLAPGPLPSPPRQWRLKEVSFDEACYHVSRNSTPSDSAHAS